MQISFRRRPRTGSRLSWRNQASSIPNQGRHSGNFRQTDDLLRPRPAKLSGQTFVFYIQSAPHQPSHRNKDMSRGRKLTKEILHQGPIHPPSLNIPKRNNRRRNLAQTKLLHRRGKRVVRVRRARLESLQVSKRRVEGDCRRRIGLAARHHRRWQDLCRLAGRFINFWGFCPIRTSATSY